MGPCFEYEYRWHFDSDEGACREFVYGGCGGNGNLFASQEECEIKCDRQTGHRGGSVTHSPSGGSHHQTTQREQYHGGMNSVISLSI